jgi:hypothetical protein
MEPITIFVLGKRGMPLEIVRMGVEAGLLLTQQPMEPLRSRNHCTTEREDGFHLNNQHVLKIA